MSYTYHLIFMIAFYFLYCNSIKYLSVINIVYCIIYLYCFWFISDNVDETDEDEGNTQQNDSQSQSDYQSSPSTSMLDNTPSSSV